MAEFKIALDRTLKIEGPPSNSPDDPGGKTVYGISERWHPEMYHMGRDPSYEEAVEFYRETVWKKLHLDRIWSQRIANEVFDTAVNIGNFYASIWLQKAYNALRPRRRHGERFGEIREDGILGPKTCVAANEFAKYNQEWESALVHYQDYQQAVWYDASSDDTHKRGWFAKRLGEDT